MESRKSFLAILTLILAGSIVVSGDLAFAKKSKKASSKKSSKSKKSKKAETVIVSDDNSEERIATSSTTRRGSSSTSTTSTSSNTVVDEATEISNLKSNLLGCLSGQCSGDVPFEKCFKTANIETFLAANGNCQTYLNSASSETIRVLAKQQVTSKIKEYFKQSCTEAGGEVSGESCKLKLYYYARSADGKHTRKSDAKLQSIGSTFTCTYANFGLGQQDLEYKPEMSAEDKIQLIQSGIQLGTGLLNTGIQAFQAIKASKDLKRAEAADVDAWYTFDGKTLTEKAVCAKYDYGKSGAGLNGNEQTLCANVTPVNGVKTCRKEENSANCNQTTPPAGLPEVCSSTTKLDNGKTCSVFIKESNDIKRSEKTSELIRTVNDLDKLKSDAAKEERKNTRKLAIADMAYGQAITSLSNQGLSSPGSVNYCSDTKYMANYTKGQQCPKDKNITVTNINSAIECYKKDKSSSTAKCYDNNFGGWDCINNLGNCHWEPSRKEFVQGAAKDKNGNLSGNMTGVITDIVGNWNQLDSEYDTIVDNISTDKQEKYNSTISAYNTNQNSLNAKKKEVEDLKEQSSSALQNVISTGTQTILTGATTMITSKISADANRESMTGACYLGDPTAGGSFFMQEGEVKKLNWKLFN